jgi:hypothetical protein
MPPGPAFQFDSPHVLLAALLAAACIAVIALLRKPAVPRLSYALGAAGVALLALAAGEPAWNAAAKQEVVVMVDLSASTRTAPYRSRDVLERRTRELLGGVPHRTLLFAAENRPDDGARVLADLPGDRTIFAPPAAAAVVLFSDARFELPPAAPPTFVVIDAALDRTADAAVTRLEVRSGSSGGELAATV